MMQAREEAAGRKYGKIARHTVPLLSTNLAIISFSLLEECPPLPRTLAGVDRK